MNLNVLIVLGIMLMGLSACKDDGSDPFFDTYYVPVTGDTVTAQGVAETETITVTPYDTTYNLSAGYRWSPYGPEYDPGISYWNYVGQAMAGNFTDATPASIWILGVIEGTSCHLNFPVTGNYDKIYGSSTDQNEEILTSFDESGYRVWLQVEPGNANIEDLIDIVLSQYGHHACVTGFGVDVEWLESTTPEGRQVTNEEAEAWVAKIKSYNPRYRLFLKHWLTSKMPPDFRTDVVFIDDSQMFSSLNQMVNEFEYWGNYFAPAQVGFQFGYDADETWWGNFENPPKEIGDAILENVPNTQCLFWVDFTIIDVFPPPVD